MAQNGNDRNASSRVQSWREAGGLSGTASAAAGGASAASIASPSGSCPTSSGRRLWNTAFRGASVASTTIPSSMTAARQP